MPELPELDVLAENLAARLGGARVASVRVVSVAALKTFDPPIDALVGRAVTGAGRRAKYVWLELGELLLVMHLSLGGRLVLGAKPASRKVAALTVELDDGRVLSITEGGTQRRAAVWLVDDVEKVPGLAGLGPEPLDPGFTVERLAAILAEGGHTPSACSPTSGRWPGSATRGATTCSTGPSCRRSPARSGWTPARSPASTPLWSAC